MDHHLDFDIPIIQAPMAGGITTPELVAAVSNCGALGSLGAGYMFPDEIRSTIRKIKTLTTKPFSVNLFIPEEIHFKEDLTDTMQILSSIWRELSDKPFESPSFSTPSFDDQLQVIIEEKVPIFSFTFGVLNSSTIQKLKKSNIRIYGTATTPEEAQKLEETGVDAIVCQGQEAGGHRGSFSANDPLLSLFPLIMLTKKRVRVPLIAAGGIMNGYSAKAALAAGAKAVQIGTAFVTVSESGAHQVYKKALLEDIKPTMLTKAFTGKNARGIVNDFMLKFSKFPPPSYPIQHHLTKKIRALAAEQNRPDCMSLWAGQGYPLCQSITATELVKQIVRDLK